MSEFVLNEALLKGINVPHRNAHQDDYLQDPTLPKQSLADLIKQMIANGDTIELIVLAVMTNSSNNGAMDICSKSIADVTKEANELSNVQDDLIKLQKLLSKIEEELGGKKDMSKEDWDKLDIKSLLTQLKSVYNKLCTDQKTLAESKDPKIKAVADMVGDLIKDLNDSVPTPSGDTGNLSSFADLLKNWDGNTDFPVNGKNIANTLCGAVYSLAKNFYDKNHPSSSSDAKTDYLGEWVQSTGACQQLTSGTSQQEATAVQGYMQILNSFNNIGQQMNQSTAQEKGSMVRNQRAG